MVDLNKINQLKENKESDLHQVSSSDSGGNNNDDSFTNNSVCLSTVETKNDEVGEVNTCLLYTSRCV